MPLSDAPIRRAIAARLDGGHIATFLEAQYCPTSTPVVYAVPHSVSVARIESRRSAKMMGL